MLFSLFLQSTMSMIYPLCGVYIEVITSNFSLTLHSVICDILPIHSPEDGQSICFQLLSLARNTAAMRNLAQGPIWRFVEWLPIPTILPAVRLTFPLTLGIFQLFDYDQSNRQTHILLLCLSSVYQWLWTFFIYSSALAASSVNWVFTSSRSFLFLFWFFFIDLPEFSAYSACESLVISRYLECIFIFCHVSFNFHYASTQWIEKWNVIY